MGISRNNKSILTSLPFLTQSILVTLMNHIGPIDDSSAAMVMKESATIKSQIALVSANVVGSVTFDHKYVLLSL